MPKILCIHSGLTGILNSSFELVSRLEADGNECIIASPKKVEKEVLSQGFKFLQLNPVVFDPAPEIPEFKDPLNKFRRLIHKIQYAQRRREEAVESLGMELFLEKIKKEDPDEILMDIELHEHIMTLVTHGFKVKLLSQWFSTWNRKGLPPIVTDIIPGRGLRGSEIGIAFAWQKIKIQRWWMFLKKRVLSVGTDRRSILLKYAKEVGFSRSMIKENYWPGPFSYDKLPVLSMTDYKFEFPHQIRHNMEYIGRMVYENRVEHRVPDEILTKIEGIIGEKQSENKKLIYCSVSTFKEGDERFLTKVTEAVSNRPEWLMILGLGGKLSHLAEKGLPENIHAFAYVPQLIVLRAADLSINHGGIHTINECLHFKLPMLVYSGKRSDQNGCAARVQYHGLGLMGDKDCESTTEIMTKIDVLLNNT